jgi:cell division protein FtsX
MNFRKVGVAGAVLALVGTAQAQIVTYADPVLALTAVGDTAEGFAPIMYGMAVLVTGIMLGIAWIKKGKSVGR